MSNADFNFNIFDAFERKKKYNCFRTSKDNVRLEICFVYIYVTVAFF